MVHAVAIINACKTLVADLSQWLAIVGSPLRRFSWFISSSLQERVYACQRSMRETRNRKLETRNWKLETGDWGLTAERPCPSRPGKNPSVSILSTVKLLKNSPQLSFRGASGGCTMVWGMDLKWKFL